MKKFSRLLSALFVIILSAGIISCEKRSDAIHNSNGSIKSKNASSDVIATYYSDLPDYTDSIQLISNSHPLINEAKNRPEYDSANISKIHESSIHYYSYDAQAVILNDTVKDHIFAYVLNSNNGNFIDSFITDIEYITKLVEGEEVKELKVNIQSIEHDIDYEYSSSNSDDLKEAGGSWGECMDDAMDELFNDWEDDPVGTFTCWVSAQSCLVGAGLACGIQQL